MNVKIAVVQFKIDLHQPTRNLLRIEGFVREAARKKADVIVFPEDCVTGSIFGDRRWLDANGMYRDTFCLLAKKYHIDLVTGSCMEGTPRGAFNASYYIDAQGRVLGRYEKNHLYHSERHFLTPGTEVSVFSTRYGKAGIVICWDILFPEIFERMAQCGVDVVYCPSYWYREIAGVTGRSWNVRSEEDLIDAMSHVRAVENNIIFVYANAAGVMRNPDGTRDTLIGHSQITQPFTGPIKKLNHNREEMCIQTVDLSLLQVSESVYRLRHDLQVRQRKPKK